MNLNDEQRRALRGKAHKLKPVVLLGKAGLTEPVLAEVNSALDFHELIKVKVRDDDREQRRETITALVSRCGAELIQVIGQIAVLYRPSPEKKAPSKPASRNRGRDTAPSSRRTTEKSRKDTRSRSNRSDESRNAFPKTNSRRPGADRRPPRPSRKRS